MKRLVSLLAIASFSLVFWPPQALSQAESPSGWDYNLTKRCVRSVDPSGTNGYEDTAQCDDSERNWTIAVQSEQALGESCTGVANQSLPINGTDGLVSMNWGQHVDENGNDNWTVQLHTDVSSKTHPCGENTFTWVMFMDHVSHGGGPFPRPDHIVFTADVNYNDFVSNGATRAIAMWSGWWDSKARSIEMTVQGSNWGDNYPGNSHIVSYINNDQIEFVLVDGSAWGITVPKLETTTLAIDWTAIIQDLIDMEFLQMPSGGWEESATVAVGLGHETHAFSSSEAAISDYWFTNFRVKDTSVTPAPTPSPTASPVPSPTPAPTPSPTASPVPSPDRLLLRIDGQDSSTRRQLETFHFSGTFSPNVNVSRGIRRLFSDEISFSDLPDIIADSSGNISWSFTPTCQTPVGTYQLVAAAEGSSEPSNFVYETIASHPDCVANPEDYGLREGDLVSVGDSDPDIFIVNEHGFKRLFLNPVIFGFYGHLGGFQNLKRISSPTRDVFGTSGLFRNCEINDEKVYGVEVTGEDSGILHWIDIDGERAAQEDPDFFNKVFCINNNEFNWYPKSNISYTSLGQVPVYQR